MGLVFDDRDGELDEKFLWDASSNFIGFSDSVVKTICTFLWISFVNSYHNKIIHNFSHIGNVFQFL